MQGRILHSNYSDPLTQQRLARAVVKQQLRLAAAMLNELPGQLDDAAACQSVLAEVQSAIGAVHHYRRAYPVAPPPMLRGAVAASREAQP